MLLRFIGAGALALALLIAPDGSARAAGGPIVTGKCWCAIGYGMFTAACGSKRATCTRLMCAAACQARVPKKTSAQPLTDISSARRMGIPRPQPSADPWHGERPQRPGHEFQDMWSRAADMDRSPDVVPAHRIHRVRTAHRHARVLRWRHRGDARRAALRSRSPARVVAPQPAAPGAAYLIAFAGIGRSIDLPAAQRIASAQQRTLRVFGFGETGAAVDFLRRQPGTGHSVLGFSQGASATTLARYVAALDRAGVARPSAITTVGLSDRSPAYRSATIPVVNYLDHSGQRHVGEPGTVNLGAKVSHLDPRTGGMARVAALVAPAPERSPLVALPQMLGKALADALDALTAPRTAVYDISGHTVYLPNGDRLEAHSGLGPAHDNPRLAHVRNHGPTPPNVYRLTMRESAFHGVRALRLNPVDETRMHGRDGILAHTYMRSGGQSAGCLVFRNYPAFLSAFEHGVVDRIAVVARIAGIGAADLAPPVQLERQALAGRAHRQRHARVRYARHARLRG